MRFFFHPGCVAKHKIYNSDKKIVKCEGPFKQLSTDSGKTEMKKTTTTLAGVSRDRMGSTRSIGSTGSAANTSMSAGKSWD